MILMKRKINSRNHKPSGSNKPIKHLEEFQEYVGILHEILENEVTVVLVFLTKTTIALPADEQVKKILNKNIGKKIGVLRTDNKSMPYLIRNADVKL